MNRGDAWRMIRRRAKDTENRDHAMMFCFLITACRSTAIAAARVGYLERTDNHRPLFRT